MSDCLAARRQSCENRTNHTLGPSGYIALQEWFREMNKTHKQRKCEGCGLWLIWEPREVDDE